MEALVLRRLALRLEATLAHEATATGDIERHDDPGAPLEMRDVGPDVLDDAEGLVAEDVTGPDPGDEAGVEVEIRAAQRRRRYADDRVRRFADHRIR
jgi:hypothetical protein